MRTVRSFLFLVWTYAAMAIIAVGLSPALLMPHRVAMGVVHLWARVVLFGMRWIVGATVRAEGLEHRPTGAALVASKHQGMLDIVALIDLLPDPCFVLKKELMPLPFIGWFAWKTGMIPVDREGGAKALKTMADTARRRLSEGRQIIIFPEGTRTEPGKPGDYKPGVAAIYRDLDGPCWPVATDSGLRWPAHGMQRNPGVATFAFLEPIPAGLKRGAFMNELTTRIETRSMALLS